MSVTYNSLDCIGCGVCLDVCKNSAFTPGKNYAIHFDELACINCTDCAVAENCLNECVTKLDGKK